MKDVIADSSSRARRRDPAAAAARSARWPVHPVATLAMIASLALAGCSGAPIPDEAAIPARVVKLDPVAISHRISAYRQAHDLAPVTLDGSLVAIAQAQADAMAGADHLSHEVAGTLDHRLNAAHHAKGYAVENVSAGYATADAALAGWQRSAPHNANLLYGPMRHMGIAAAEAPGTRFKTFWALVMTD